MQNKTPKVQKRWGQSEAAVNSYSYIVTKNFDINLKPSYILYNQIFCWEFIFALFASDVEPAKIVK